MKKNTKKILSLSVLALFLFTFSLQFVAAANGDAGTLGTTGLEATRETVLGPIGSWFASWTTGDLSANIAKYLFWALISMLVYSVAGKIPGLDSMKAGLKGIFSTIIGFLAMAYITPAEVYSLMTSYSALGFVLGGMLPFVILFFFTIEIATGSSTKGPTKRLTAKIMAMAMWVLFSAFIFMRAIGATNTPGTSSVLEWTIFSIAVIITISMTTIFKKVRDSLQREKKDKFKENIEKHKAVDKGKEEEFEASS